MLRLSSPAKVNLFLHVGRRRADGFHPLVTVFERISLADEMEFFERPKGLVLECDLRSLPKGPKNIVWKAARLLQEESGTRKGARIVLKKRIPVAGGLGGGSSNAATTLVGLNRLWKLGFSQARLLKLAARLGSDVPFFVFDAPLVLGRGRGERLRRLGPPPRKLWHVLVRPPFGVSTRAAYAAFDASFLTPPEGDVKILLHSIKNGRTPALARSLFNSLEVALNTRVKTISQIKEELLRRGALGALLSGSGSTVFGLFPTRSGAERAARAIGRNHRGWKTFSACTL